MDQLTSSHLAQLIAPTDQTCISFYMPTHKTSPDSHQNPIRFQNLIKSATNQLKTSPLVNHNIKESLKTLTESLDDPDFWMHQSLSLAIFINEDSQLVLRLPLQLNETVFIGQRYHLKPLLPLLTTNGKYFVLTLSQSDIKLYSATRTTIDKQFLGETPRSLEDFLGDEDLEPNLQFRSLGKRHKGAHKSAYHGQGGASDDNTKPKIDQFIGVVESHITKILNGETAPLVLVGLDQITSMYRKHNSYNHLLDEEINKNPIDLTKKLIHELSFEIVRPHFKQAEKDALDAYFAQNNNGKSSKNIEEIIPAAMTGKVHALFVLRDHPIWGNYDPKSNQLTKSSEQTLTSEDLADLATVHTLVNGGTAYSLKQHEMPKGLQIAALFRY